MEIAVCARITPDKIPVLVLFDGPPWHAGAWAGKMASRLCETIMR
jgi:hypothetical protein